MAQEAELILSRPGVDDGIRECPLCLSRKPLTPEFFNKDRHAPQGFRPICRECRAKERREERRSQQIADLERVKRKIKRNIVTGKGSKIPPNTEELASILLDEWGGERQVMVDLVADYRATPVGAARQKYMALAVQIIQKGSEARPVVPLEQMSDEELDIALEHALAKRLENGRGDSESEDEAPVG